MNCYIISAQVSVLPRSNNEFEYIAVVCRSKNKGDAFKQLAKHLEPKRQLFCLFMLDEITEEEFEIFETIL